MKLKNKLYFQNMGILFLTVIITLTVTLLYATLYENQTPGVSDAGLIVIERNGNITFTNSNLSDSQLKSAIMDTKTGKSTLTIGNTGYFSSVSETDTDGTIYTFTPILDLSSYYTNLAAILISVFTVTFCLCALYVSKINNKTIAKPLISLKNSTDMLSNGELDTPVHSSGETEIRDLCDSVEKLRLKLKESIHYREKSDDNRKFLLSGISHDLRTPITSAKGYIEGLIDGVADTPEKQQKYLKSALVKINTINTMIDDLLLYSKLDLNNIPFETETVELTEFLSEYTEVSKSDFHKNQKLLAFDKGEIKHAYVAIDKTQFKRVLQNILSNAEKHILPDTGKVEILLRETSASFIVEIKDNGCGISKEDLPNIFNRFYKGNSARTTDGSSGLGLTIAKQIIEGMNGIMWALSEEGRGTSIMISLEKQRS